MKTVLKTLVLATVLATSAASATVLTSRVHADDNFIAYLSTSDTVEGSAFSRGDAWQTAFTGTTADLLAGQDYYLHIVVNDTWEKAGFLGQFTLNGTTHTFANGGRFLTTNTTDWNANSSGFNGVYGAELGGYGVNGADPWKFQAGMSETAQWIWAGSQEWNDTAYFSTKISAVKQADVPEPASLALLGLGLADVAAATRRRKA